MKEEKQSWIIRTVDWAYDQALEGAGAVESAYELANDYLKSNKDRESAIDNLVKWQTVKCTTSGFITGFGGLITLPVTVPANVASVMFIQLRMIAAISIIRGYDPKDDKVKALAYACLTGSAATDILKGVGVKIGHKSNCISIYSVKS